ncbi:RNA 3'-terminal phosphate cyclase [Methanolobus halotolerans]|uniref:RNA 3'-terminal phosphate cyclase n=1 Tax=Methanolobus halotolerans TaxID=2052935 RepID=A0A4E0PWV6_9EURY|nr:RNA 3'-terminal phosphate cyclase [Methanolobus halotolerans]TGC07229.1 RNA 3'-phosphate cyclase [Methanolobus halotolerans]
MIKIDGSYGEGGGQILRTSVSLSAVAGEEVTIKNIRKNRPHPGLKPQHMRSIETAALICEAEVEGLYPGSTEIRFSPLEIRGTDATIDIGTAGSIPLLIQCIMPLASVSSGSIKLSIMGGTDVAWSPSVDYLENVTLGALSHMGYRAKLETIARGYYPKGGGIVELTIEPASLTGYDFLRRDEHIYGISHASNLPEHVAKRQAGSAEEILREKGFDCKILVDSSKYLSTGSGINLWSGFIGSVALGERGLPAEKVGSRAAEEIAASLLSGAAVDSHLADQLIPFMGIAGSGSFTTTELTGHLRTNIWVTEQFLDVKFDLKEADGLASVCIR